MESVDGKQDDVQAFLQETGQGSSLGHLTSLQAPYSGGYEGKRRVHANKDVSRILDPFNTRAHTARLKTDYQQLVTPEILSCVEDDILSINPQQTQNFKQLSSSEKITVLLGFPEERIKRAIGILL